MPLSISGVYTPPPNKTHKVQVYYNVSIQDENGNQLVHRVWINKKDKGLWAAVRDVKLGETITPTEQKILVEVIFTLNYNKAIIDNWESTMIIFNGKTYKVVAKPDEYNYIKGDIKVYASKRNDNKIPNTEEYLL